MSNNTFDTAVLVPFSSTHFGVLENRDYHFFEFHPPNLIDKFFCIFKADKPFYLSVYDSSKTSIGGVRYNDDYTIAIAVVSGLDKFYVRIFNQDRGINAVSVRFAQGNPSSYIRFDNLKPITIAVGQNLRVGWWAVTGSDDLNLDNVDTSVENVSIADIDGMYIQGKNAGQTTLKYTSKLTGISATIDIIVIPKPFFEGDGTERKPYQIRTINDLYNVRYDLTATYEQMNDIDLVGFEWIPIGTFRNGFQGKYFGNNRKISNVRITEQFNYSNQSYGLFSFLKDGALHDIVLEQVNIDTSDVNITNNANGRNRYVGALVGDVHNGVITNCHATSGSVICSPNTTQVGGLIGFIDNGSKVAKCSANVLVKAATWVGGLIGQVAYTEVSNSFAVGTLDTTTSNRIGGLIGFVEHAEVENCYSAVASNAETFGGLIGMTTNGIVRNCYYDEDVAHISVGIGIEMSTAQMKQQATFVGWDFEKIWSIDENESYPYFLNKINVLCKSIPFPINIKQMTVN